MRHLPAPCDGGSRKATGAMNSWGAPPPRLELSSEAPEPHRIPTPIRPAGELVCGPSKSSDWAKLRRTGTIWHDGAYIKRRSVPVAPIFA